MYMRKILARKLHKKITPLSQVGNWTKCNNCKGTGLSREWSGNLGRHMPEAECPTCGGVGGWPTKHYVDVNARLNTLLDNYSLLKI